MECLNELVIWSNRNIRGPGDPSVASGGESLRARVILIRLQSPPDCLAERDVLARQSKATNFIEVSREGVRWFNECRPGLVEKNMRLPMGCAGREVWRVAIAHRGSAGSDLFPQIGYRTVKLAPQKLHAYTPGVKLLTQESMRAAVITNPSDPK